MLASFDGTRIAKVDVHQVGRDCTRRLRNRVSGSECVSHVPDEPDVRVIGQAYDLRCCAPACEVAVRLQANADARWRAPRYLSQRRGDAITRLFASRPRRYLIGEDANERG